MLFNVKSMMQAAGLDVDELEARFKMLHETAQAGYVAFVDVQAKVHTLMESNARIEAALTVLMQDRNKAVGLGEHIQATANSEPLLADESSNNVEHE